MASGRLRDLCGLRPPLPLPTRKRTASAPPDPDSDAPAPPDSGIVPDATGRTLKQGANATRSAAPPIRRTSSSGARGVAVAALASGDTAEPSEALTWWR